MRLLIALFIVAAGVASCQVPVTLSPSSVPAGSGDLVLTVRGSGFDSGSYCESPPVITWVVGNSTTPLSTTFVDTSTLQAVVPASLLQNSVTATILIQTTSFQPNNYPNYCVTRSLSATFTVTAALAASCNNPPVAVVDQPYTHTLTASGGNAPYVWTRMGIAPEVTLNASGVISGIFRLGDVGVRTFTATVRDSSPSTAAPPAVLLTCQILVTNIAPVVTSYDPKAATACGPAFNLTVTGSNLLSGVIVGFGDATGIDRLSPTRTANTLVVSVPERLILAPRSATVMLGNPGTTAGTYVFSDPQPFQVRPTPVIQSLSASSATAGGTAMTLTITGSNFVPSVTRVRWQNGSAVTDLPITQSSTTQLAVQVAASLLATAGQAQISVVNVEPANPTGISYPISCSAPATFAISPPALQISAVSLPSGMVGTTYPQQTFSASGGTPPYTWDISAGQPPGLALSPDGLISGTPTQAGPYTLTVRVTDARNRTTTRDFPISVELPPAPRFNVTLSTQPTGPTDQPTVNLTVENEFPVALAGTLKLSFQPNATGLPSGYLDPAVRFAAGGTTLDFTIAENSKEVRLAGNSAVQQGTVAGTIVVSVDNLRVVSTNTPVPLAAVPSSSIVIARMEPAIVAGSVRITNVTGSGFSVELDGYSTPRDLTRASFTFTPATGAQLQGNTTISVPLTTDSATWFSGTTGLSNGSRFHLSVPFTLSGEPNALGTVSVTLENSAGTSRSVSGGRS